MTGHDRIWGYCTDCEQDVPIMDDGRGGCGHGRIIRRESRDAQMRAEGRVAGLREAARLVYDRSAGVCTESGSAVLMRMLLDAANKINGEADE